MAFGLFGKLPQKRDFLSVNLPHAVLNPFETWLQSGVAASRNEIGRGWEDYYLVAPIWRFWLGKEILGTACTGSLMPSVDQVGRYFPLAIIYWAEPGEMLMPPLVNPIEDWYRRIEERLLAVLSEDNPIEVNMILSGLSPPDYSTAPPRPAAPPIPAFAPAPAAPQAAPVAAEPAMSVAAPVEPAPAVMQPAVAAEEIAVPEAVASAGNGSDEPAPVDAAASPAAAKAEPSPWEPVPMPADKLAALQKISADSFAPQPVIPMGGASLWDPLPEAAPAAVEPKPDAGSSAPLWDIDPAPAPVAAAEPASAAPANHANGAPMAVLSGGSLLAAAPAAPVVPAAPPEEIPPAPPPAVAAPAAAYAPPPPSAPAPPPPPRFEVQITTSEFKGGVVSVIEGGASFSDALPQLMAIDFSNGAQTRGYWWCGASSSGGPRVFSKAGLPDPYFFTQMLMWRGK